MIKKPIKILVTEPMAEEAMSLLKKHPEFSLDICLNLDTSELKQKIASCDALLVRSQTKVNEAILQTAPNLKLIGRAGVGIDNIDVVSAKQRGIAVINTPSGNSISAAELAFGLMLSLARKLPFAHNHVKNGQWDRASFKGIELYQKTLGIIGFGNVGKQLAKRALAFDMEVVAYDPMVKNFSDGVQSRSLENLLAQADFLSLHCPMLETTKNIINQKSLSCMKKGMMIINTARGELIEDEALIMGLNEGIIAYAALDVFRAEPPAVNDPLLHHEKIMVTCHLGASTKEAQDRVSKQLAEDTIAFFAGHDIARIV